MSAELGQPGQIIDGKYRIVRLLGTGGMGAVFEGENVRIRRKVAIKMLHGSVSDQDEVLKRFENEAKAAGMVGSEHICEVLDMGEMPDGTRYMVMEYLDGETLSGVIKRAGRLWPQQSIPILAQILDALGAAHAAGIIHRDLKPDNVFVLPQKGGIQNFVKILDFGVSKFSQLSGEAMNVTRAGAVVGTPYYMSPEQARGSSAIDQRTDIYAIGVLLYQATTGQVPYQAETFNELLFKIVLEVAPPPQTYCPDLDPDFAAIIQRAMAREPNERFATCADFKAALLQYQQNLNARAQHPGAGYPGMPRADSPLQRTEMLDFSKVPGHPSYEAGARPQYPAAGRPPSPSGVNVGGSAANWPGVGGSGANWPAPHPQDGTMPMQPGLSLSGGGANTGPGSAISPLQSGASWPGAAMPSSPAMGGFVPTATTSNSWGNASSPANVVGKPGSSKGVLIGVVAAAALIGIGVAVVAVVMMGKGAAGPDAAKAPAAGPSVTATAIATTTAAPTTTAAAAPSATVTPTATAAPTATDAPVAATATASSKAAPPSTGGTKAGSGTGAKGAGTGATGKGTKSTKSGGNDLGY